MSSPTQARLRKAGRRLGLHLAALLAGAFILAPFAWLVISSIAGPSDLLERPLRWWPAHAGLGRYLTVLTTTDVNSAAYTFRRALINSSAVAFGTTVLSLVTGVPAGYVLARSRFRGRQALTIFFLSTYLLPPIALIVALYVILSLLGQRDSVVGLILVYSSFVTPFVVWIMRGYFTAVPVEIEEAARIDGCSRFETFWRVGLPLATPGLVTTIIFAILLAWDEFFYALILTSSLRAKTISVAIAEFSGQHMIDYGMIATGGVMAALPPVIIALILQKYIVQGLTAGAVKG
jgi:multiple sugar transport system permease protein